MYNLLFVILLHFHVVLHKIYASKSACTFAIFTNLDGIGRNLNLM